MTSSPSPANSSQLSSLIERCLLQDRSKLRGLLRAIGKREKQKLGCDKLLQKAQRIIEKSLQIVAKREAVIPNKISFDELLPVSQARSDVAKLIKDNQVVVLAGETGSGKTTQLPKICLELGLGVKGRIGHTQPRRVAATSVARRIAQELNSEIGQVIGYSIRFNSQASEITPVRVMTDGILLNEIIKDPLLEQYDTIIIDEAHERSLNIDFLLGYLKQILPKRPDLKLIITSATIDLERFSKHFSFNGKPAPVLEISGRTYPVETWYRETDEENPTPLIQHIGQAVDEIINFASGDILIFLSGEAEIRETAKLLRKEKYQSCEVLPLYARLSIKEQERIFKPSGGKRRVVLATNVAETSITVPGIRYVIDPGFARMSRYSVRHKIQRLPIEKISQASANQRKGRCGRVSDGICVRLYSQEDFELRPQFTDAEILRTNLAAVILQMKQMKFGDIADFPFIDRPSDKQINDGLNLLVELQALNSQKDLTPVGRKMAHLPIEPRLSRILLAGLEQECLTEMLIIAAFLSVKDPRERPFDKKEVSNQKHAKYQQSQSDFMAILNMWSHLHQQKEDLSNSQFRNYCQQELINANAYREWLSTFRQLKSLMLQAKDGHRLAALKIAAEEEKQTFQAQYLKIHKALLTGLLTYVGQKDIELGYLGTRQSRYFVHPQSVNFKKQPAWLMAFEIVDTSKTYARLSALIEPLWLEDTAAHMLKTHHYDAHWSKKRGAVVALMQQSLLGLRVVHNRQVDYSAIEPKLCRQLFILHGLVRQELDVKHPFFIDNGKLQQKVSQEIAKTRQADLAVDEIDICAWFEQKLPEHICNAKQLNQWLKKEPAKHNKALGFSKETLLKKETNNRHEYPEFIEVKNIKIKLNYHFEPGHKSDGVTARIPKSLSNQFRDSDFERLVPGLLEEKIEYLIRSLPKRYRKNFVPVPQFAKACYEIVLGKKGLLLDTINKHLYKMTGVILPSEAWEELNLPEHYLMRFEVIDDKGRIVSASRSLDNLTLASAPNGVAAKASASKAPKQQFLNQTFTDWPQDFVKNGFIKEAGTKVPVFYAVEDAQDKVRVISLVNKKSAGQVHLRGVCRLLAIKFAAKIKYLQKSYHNRQKLSLAASSLQGSESLINNSMLAIIKSKLEDSIPYSAKQLLDSAEAMESELIANCQSLLDDLLQVLEARNSLMTQVKKLPASLKSTKDNIKQQLDLLFTEGFCYRYGASKVRDYKRYMNAVEKRLERALNNPLKEAQSIIQFNHWYQEHANLEKNSFYPKFEVDQYLWMLEEYRISLFAQGIKTRFPISDKRLQKFIDRLAIDYK